MASNKKSVELQNVDAVRFLLLFFLNDQASHFDVIRCEISYMFDVIKYEIMGRVLPLSYHSTKQSLLVDDY